MAAKYNAFDETKADDEAREISVYLIQISEICTTYENIEYDFNEILNKYIHINPEFLNDIRSYNLTKNIEIAKVFRGFREGGPQCKGTHAFEYESPGRRGLKTKKILYVTSYYKPMKAIESHPDRMVISFEQANLLAALKSCKIADYYYTSDDRSIKLPPMAKAIFPPSSIKLMVYELKTSTLGVVKTVITSCEPGGEHLKSSSFACALAAKYAAVSGATNKALQMQVLNKLCRQYAHQKKPFSNRDFAIFYKYAMKGSEPPNISLNELLNQPDLMYAKFSEVDILQMSTSSKRTIVPDY